MMRQYTLSHRTGAQEIWPLRSEPSREAQWGRTFARSGWHYADGTRTPYWKTPSRPDSRSSPSGNGGSQQPKTSSLAYATWRLGALPPFITDRHRLQVQAIGRMARGGELPRIWATMDHFTSLGEHRVHWAWGRVCSGDGNHHVPQGQRRGYNTMGLAPIPCMVCLFRLQGQQDNGCPTNPAILGNVEEMALGKPPQSPP